MTREQEDAALEMWRRGRSRRQIVEALGVPDGQVRWLLIKLKPERDRCGCGRPAGHHGHCRERGDDDKRLAAAFRNFALGNAKWTAESVEILKRDYPRKIPLEDIQAAVVAAIGRPISLKAVMEKARLLRLVRKRCKRRVMVRTKKPSPPPAKRPWQTGFTMLSGPDPHRELKLQQATRGSRGRL